MLLPLIFSSGAATQPLTLDEIDRMIDMKLYSECFTRITDRDVTLLGSRALLLRAECAYHIGKYDAAITDLTSFLSIPSHRHSSTDLQNAYSLRCQCNVRLGLLTEAANDFSQVSSPESLCSTISTLQQLACRAASFEAGRKYARAIAKYDDLLKSCNASVFFHVRRASCAWHSGNVTLFRRFYETAIQPRDAELETLRARDSFCDNRPLTTRFYLRECIQSSPGDRNLCFALWQNLTRFIEVTNQAISHLNAYQHALASELSNEYESMANEICLNRSRCQNLSAVMHFVLNLSAKIFMGLGNETTAWDRLKCLPKKAEILVMLGWVAESAEVYDWARPNYEGALELDAGNHFAKEGLERINNYRDPGIDAYEILEVDPTSDHNEILNARDRLVKKWHPDRHRHELLKKKGQKMTGKIDQAWECLKDKERRRAYDTQENVNEECRKPPVNHPRMATFTPPFLEQSPFPAFPSPRKTVVPASPSPTTTASWCASSAPPSSSRQRHASPSPPRDTSTSPSRVPERQIPDSSDSGSENPQSPETPTPSSPFRRTRPLSSASPRVSRTASSRPRTRARRLSTKPLRALLSPLLTVVTFSAPVLIAGFLALLICGGDSMTFSGAWSVLFFFVALLIALFRPLFKTNSE
jgi:curved DNA-binding protein CbpA